MRTRARRKRDRFTRAYGSDAFVQYVRALPCVVCGGSPCDTAHLRHSRGAGGGPQDCAPLCRPHHIEQGSAGIVTWAERHGIDVDAVCRETWERWCQGGGINFAEDVDTATNRP